MNRLLPCCALFLVCLWLLSAPSEAHRPLFPQPGHAVSENPFAIPDLATSWAIYGRTDDQGESVYEVRGEEGDKLSVELLVPTAGWQGGSWPRMTVLGPKGEKLAEGPAQGGKPERFFEPFTQTSYFRVHSESLTITDSGMHRIKVTSQHPNTQHVLAPGHQERWGLADLARFPLIWLQVRFWVSPWVGLGGIGVGLLLLAVVFFLVRRKFGGRDDESALVP